MGAIRTVGVAAAAASLLLAGCSDGSEESTPTPAAPATQSPTTATATPSPSSAATDDTVEVEITIDGREVVPAPSRTRVAEGATVRLVITSDIANEVHVHGYELYEDLPAGRATTLEFTADQTGLFEVETHEAPVLVLTQLQVQ